MKISNLTYNHNQFTVVHHDPEIREPCRPSPCGINAVCRERKMLAHVVVCPAILVIHIQNVAPNVSTTMIAQSRRPVSTTNVVTHVSAFAVRIQSVKWWIIHRIVPVCLVTLAIHRWLALKFVRSSVFDFFCLVRLDGHHSKCWW